MMTTYHTKRLDILSDVLRSIVPSSALAEKPYFSMDHFGRCSCSSKILRRIAVDGERHALVGIK